MQTLQFEMCITASPLDKDRVIAVAEDAVASWFGSVTTDGPTLRAAWVAQAASGRRVAAKFEAIVADRLMRLLGYRPEVTCQAVPADEDW